MGYYVYWNDPEYTEVMEHGESVLFKNPDAKNLYDPQHEVRVWCEQELRGPYTIDHWKRDTVLFIFRNHTDAVHFKLFWS